MEFNYTFINIQTKKKPPQSGSGYFMDVLASRYKDPLPKTNMNKKHAWLYPPIDNN